MDFLTTALANFRKSEEKALGIFLIEKIRFPPAPRAIT
jgi:hypothetical protein